jgi:hypothetical protein
MSRLTAVATLLFSLSLIALTVSADTADLAIGSARGDENIYAGEFMIVDVTVRNNGPDRAQNVVLSIDFPDGVTFDRIFAQRDSCDTTRKPVRCALGDFGAGESQFLTVRAVAPLANGNFPLSVTASSDAEDPVAGNNTFTQTFTAQLVTAFYIDLGAPRLRIDPATAFTTPIRIGNNLHVTNPGNIRLHFDVVNGTIERFDPVSVWSCTTTPTSVDCALPPLTAGCACALGASITVRAPADRAGGELRIVPTITSDLPNIVSDQTSKVAQIYHWFPVTTTADAGPGSLRDAITQANASYGDGPCRIAFEIATPVPAEGWFTITPSTPLPQITAKRVIVDGARQTAFSGDTNPRGPEVAIDGRLAGSGLALLSACEAVVDGLALGNFMTDQGLWLSASRDFSQCSFNDLDRREVLHDYIGVDPTGTTAWPNLRGLRADFTNSSAVHDNVISDNRFSGIWMWSGSAAIHDNRIERNGASGIFLGPGVTHADIMNNTIADHREMGVAVARGAAGFDIRRNSLRHNAGLGIDVGLDGRDPQREGAVNPPVLLSASYDAAAGKTRVAMTLQDAPFSGNYAFAIDFYANDTPDGDGEVWVDSRGTSGSQGQIVFEIAGDLRGKWLNATAMRYEQVFARPPSRLETNGSLYGIDEVTSELSNTVLVQ